MCKRLAEQSGIGKAVLQRRFELGKVFGFHRRTLRFVLVISVYPALPGLQELRFRSICSNDPLPAWPTSQPESSPENFLLLYWRKSRPLDTGFDDPEPMPSANK